MPMMRQSSRQHQGGCSLAWLLFLILAADCLGNNGYVSAKNAFMKLSKHTNHYETGLGEAGEGSPRLRVACVGDSLTRGDATHEPLGSKRHKCPPQFGGRCSQKRGKWLLERGNYPAELQRLLGPRFHVRNFGVGACTASRTLPEHPTWPLKSECDGTKQFHDAAVFRPHVVVMMMGTNDAKEGVWDPSRFAAALVDMAQNITNRLSEQGPPHRVLVVPPPALQPVFTIQPHVIANEIPPEVYKAAAQLQEKLPKHTDSNKNATRSAETSSSTSSSCGSGSVQVANMQEVYGTIGCRWCEGCAPEELHRKDKCGRLFVKDSIHTSAYGSQVIAKAIAAALSSCQPPPEAAEEV